MEKGKMLITIKGHSDGKIKSIVVDKSETVMFTGFRPDKLPGGYNLRTKENMSLYEQLYTVAETLINMGYKNFITGTALGVDTLAYFAIHNLKKRYQDIQNIVFLPIRNQGSNWIEKDVNNLKFIYNTSDLIYLTESNISPKASIGEKMNFRNSEMVRVSSVCISVYDGEAKGGTRNATIEALSKGLRVIMVDPNTLRLIDSSRQEIKLL